MNMDAKRKKVMMVDDDLTDLIIGKKLLKLRYEVYPISSAARMFKILQKVVPDLILLDISMPEMDGYEAIRHLKADMSLADIPVIFLTSKSDERSEMEGFDLGAADYIFKPFSPPLLIKRIENQLLIARQKLTIRRHAEDLSNLVSQKNEEVHNLQRVILAAIGNLIDLRDKYTGRQISRVQMYMKTLIEGLFKKDLYTDETALWNLDLVLPSVQLYDVGKIGIPDTILNRSGELSKNEKEILKTHVDIGREAIEKIINGTSKSDFLLHALHIVGSHHERWDGSGYPKGLRGEEIPLEARLMAVVDAYDELISWRPYKKAYTHEEAKRIIEDGAGKRFDPVLVDVFESVEEEFYQITLKYRLYEQSDE